MASCFSKTISAVVKRNITVLIAIGLAASMQACVARQSSCSLDGADCRPRPKIALILQSIDDDNLQQLAVKAQEQAQADQSLDMDVLWPQSGNRVPGQISLVEHCVSSGYDVIAISPVHSAALVPSLKKAHDAGIIVVTFQNSLDNSAMQLNGLPDNLLYVGPDNVATARNMGGLLGGILPENSKVAMLAGSASTARSASRVQGFTMAADDHNLKLVAVENAEWSAPRAKEITAALIRQYPDIKGIMACSDEMADGSLQAIEEAGLGGQILVVGFGNTTTGRKLLQEGKILATADSHGYRNLQKAVNIGLRVLHGEAMHGWIQTPSDIITSTAQAAD